MLGFATLTKKPDARLVLPEASHGWVKWAFLFFAAAAIGALVATLPGIYKRPGWRSLETLLKESWGDSADTATKEVVESQLDFLSSASFWNDLKGWALFAGVFFEGGALVCIARAVWLAL